MGTTVREQTDGHVRRLTLCRPEQYNTITPELRDELGSVLDGLGAVVVGAQGAGTAAAPGADHGGTGFAQSSRDAPAGASCCTCDDGHATAHCVSFGCPGHCVSLPAPPTRANAS